MSRTRQHVAAAWTVVTILMTVCVVVGAELGPGRGLHTLPGDLPGPATRQPGVLYDLDLREERFFILIAPTCTNTSAVDA